MRGILLLGLVGLILAAFVSAGYPYARNAENDAENDEDIANEISELLERTKLAQREEEPAPADPDPCDNVCSEEEDPPSQACIDCFENLQNLEGSQRGLSDETAESSPTKRGWRRFWRGVRRVIRRIRIRYTYTYPYGKK